MTETPRTLESLTIASLTQDQIWERLRTVIDPETQLNVVDMGLIYSAQLIPPIQPVSKNTGEPTEAKLWITYTLTTPLCPLAGVFHELIAKAFADVGGILHQNLIVEVSFDPPWSLDRMSPEARAELGF